MIGLAAIGGAAAWAGVHASAPAVRRWRPSELDGRQVGLLWTQVGGTGPGTTLLLHGLVASGRFWSAHFVDRAAPDRVLIPDLLGFGRSLDGGESFSPEDHVSALSDLLDAAGSGGRITIAAHSFGTTLALRLAVARGDVERLVLIGAPVTTATPARAARRLSPMGRLFGLDTGAARLACRINCSNRTFSGWLAAAIEPSLPVPVARDASRHRWASYRAAVDTSLSTDWPGLIEQLSGCDVLFVTGTDDRLPDRSVIDDLVRRHAAVEHVVVPGGHRLPLEDPVRCAALVGGVASRRPSAPRLGGPDA